MDNSSFLNLANEVLIEVLTQLNRIGDNQDLVSCLRVSRRWHEIATTVLYRNVALRHENLSRFCESLGARRHAACVRSITTSFPHDCDTEQVTQLVPLLCQFSMLRSFSFWLGKRFDDATPAVSQSTLIQLVNALPPSCTNLELDTCFNEVSMQGETPHLCDSLRSVLPQMQHVRLRCRSCKDLFSDPSRPHHTIKMPQLKSFMYSCTRPPGPAFGSCRTPNEYNLSLYAPDSLWPTVTHNLARLLMAPDAIPPNAQVYAFTTSEGSYNDYSHWPAHIRADMRTKTSLVLPHRFVWPETEVRGSHVLRLLGGEEVMCTSSGIQDVAEGRFWREVRGGARLPASVLADARAERSSFAAGCEEVPLAYLKSSNQWREEHPRKKLQTWSHEDKMGVRLIDAEVRKGEDKYLSLNRVKEITPAGYRRASWNGELEKI